MKMRRIILILCLLGVAAVWLSWPRSERAVSPVAKPNAPALRAVAASAPTSPSATNQTFAVVKSSPSPASVTNPFPFRLANTPKTIGQLTGTAHAILLENALVDTDAKVDLSIPQHLQAGGEPGAFIVQARGVTGAAFRAALAGAGAEIVSYIPNNAYLVRLSAAGAAKLSVNPQVLAVLPYAPYFKISSVPLAMVQAQSVQSQAASWSRFPKKPPISKLTLLGLAVQQKALPEGMDLTLGLFANGAPATKAAIENLGGTIVSTDRSPFGQVVRVHPPTNWIVLAQLPGVHRVEPACERQPANDLSRVTLGVATTPTTTANYLNLTGSNVVVEVNDTGVDTNHPDFFSRLVLDDPGSGYDTAGHGTHVAGSIAGSGLESTTVTFASGSPNPGSPLQYRGKAPAAKLYSVGALGNDPLATSDSYLQEQPAKNHALISNNSWASVDIFGNVIEQYDLRAASYDAAVRDAVPESTGPQPVLFVFAAGNDGESGNNGLGGKIGSITSPGTAKNVITVGALEQYRQITNVVLTYYNGNTYNSNGVPDQLFYPRTDSSNQVAYYSSRGNVGVGTEGAYGRFKPDVVAPGTMVVSTRSTTWQATNAYYGNNINYHYPIYDVYPSYGAVDVGYDSPFTFSVPPNAASIAVDISANFLSAFPFPNLGIYVSTGASIDTNLPATYQIYKNNNTVSIPPDGPVNYLQAAKANGSLSLLVTDTTTGLVYFDIVVTIVTTNDDNFIQVLQGMNAQLGPYYLYDQGTSMATPAVSGTLALMQDFFTNTLHLTPSPALLKAMLINGARVTDSIYNYAVNLDINYQGWGVPQLPNSIPQNLNTANSPLYFLDQSPTNVLATGDSRTFIVNPSDKTQPLRITLAWTDPPGNPVSAVKLVNNLDLVVTNLTTGEIYYGNYFDNSSPPASKACTTNDAPQYDVINNVENVFIIPTPSLPLGASYSVTVVGRSVNVNAVTLEQTNIVQDFALVIASGDNASSSLAVTPGVPVPFITPQVTDLGGSVVTFNFGQTSGANAPLLSTNLIPFGTNWGFATNAVLYIGQTNQWRFYVVSNATTFTNAAFTIYSANTLSVSREGLLAGGPDAPDVDVYVATYPSDTNAFNLTNLDSQVISNCIYGLNGDAAALSRGGQEIVSFINSSNGNVYYVGVKCEDQMGAAYNFIPAFSLLPFSSLDQYGNQYVNGVNLPVSVPDGSNTHPGYTNVLGLALYPMQSQRVVVTNSFTHQNFGDLYGVLSHNDINVVLNNHDGLGPVTDRSLGYDDSGMGNGIYTDGPGTLTNYVGTAAVGPWILTEVDDATNNTGSVINYLLKIEPKTTNITGSFIFSIPPLSWVYVKVVVPPGYTNLTVVGTDKDGYAGLDMAVGFDYEPTLPNNYDQLVVLDQPFGSYFTNTISIGPPLAPGNYYIGIYNPDSISHNNVEMDVTLSYPSWSTETTNFTSSGPVPLLDDAVTTDIITLPGSTNAFVGINVGLRVDHPRISDLVFHLISPDGTRSLLMENRGNASTNGCGLSTYITNTIPVTSSGSAAPQPKTIDTGATSGTLAINYQMYAIPDQMTVYYQGVKIFDSGYISFGGTFNIPYGPGASTLVTIVMNENTNPNPFTAWTYTVFARQALYDYLTFTEDQSLTTTPIKFAPTPFVPTTPTNLYYQAEQPIADGGFIQYYDYINNIWVLAPKSPAGTRQLEIMDNRAGAANPAPELLSWQLGVRNIKGYPYLQGFQTNYNKTIAGNSITWYEIFVPANASFATNILNSASALNLWFSTNTPPATSPAANDTLLFSSPLGGPNVLDTTNSTPPLVPGGLYFLGVQNTGGGAATYSLAVDFDHGNLFPGPASVKFKNIQINANGALLQWTPAAGSHYQVQWKDNLTDSWNTISNPPTTMSNGVATFSDTDPAVTAPLGKQRFYRLVWVP